MRTRDEQIRDIAAVRDEVNPTRTGVEAEKWAEQHILEAERRAEQRVRTEIGRDSERLDWLCRNVSGAESRRMVGVIADTGNLDLWRKAIDAAREAE